MEIVKQLGTLVEEATNDSHNEPPQQLFNKILTVVQSRADMPKNALNAVSKRLSIKNKKVLYACFDLLEYLSYHCELSLYAQISTKEFLLKLSTLLMSQDMDKSVQTKILQTIKVWDQLFRPHDDLLPMFFQFYAQILKKEFPIPKDYVSPHRPKDFKIRQQQKQQQKKKEESKSRPHKERVLPTQTQQKTFEEIRATIILTNQIIENADPSEGVKGNALLLEMMEQIKKSEKKINQTINQNPNEKIMELALASNDDIYITYRRFKDLQKNRKPEPFILAQLASDAAKYNEIQEQKKIEKEIKAKNKKKDEFDSFNEKPPSQSKVEEKPKKSPEVDIIDMNFEAQPSKPQPKQSKQPMDLLNLGDEDSSVQQPTKDKEQGNLFDLLGDEPATQQTAPTSANLDFMSSNYMGGQSEVHNQPVGVNLQTGFQTGMNQPYQSGVPGNISLSNNFTTQNDINKYDDRSIFDRLTDLSQELNDRARK